MAEITQGEDVLAALWPKPAAKPASNGGWKGNPNSIAALLRHRADLRTLPKCRYCNTVAVSGSTACRHHGGAAALGRRAAVRPPLDEATAVARALRRMERNGTLPADLLAHPAWRAHCAAKGRRGRAKIMREMVAAWLANDAGKVASVLARLRQLGLDWRG